jgi:hypothetical protein
MKYLLIVSLVLLLCGATLAYAAEPPPIDIEPLPQNTYAPGEYSFGPFNVPAQYKLAYANLTSDLWNNPAGRVEWIIELSQDGGATWGDAPMVAGGTSTATLLCPLTAAWTRIPPCDGPGAPFSFRGIAGSMPQPENNNRRIRGTVFVIGAPVPTSVTAGLR